MLPTTAVVLALVAFGCRTAPAHVHDLSMPALADWVDCGTALLAGREGEWDLYLWGGFTSSVLKRGGKYLLYYQGSDGYHEGEHTVTNRAIGVATSTDGVRFMKHPGNPVLTFSRWNNHEEGAVSSAPFVDEANRVIMYYGANTWAGADRVNADARLAISEDGIHFTDQGIILDHTDASIWGWGDELFPVLAFRHGESQLLYYIPNGTRQRGQLGVARSDGDAPLRTAPVLSGRRPIQAWGSGSAVRIDSDVYALFLGYSRGNERYMEVRTMSPAQPEQVSAPVHRYEWDGIAPRAVLLDQEEDRWLLYYRAEGRYGVMVAGTQPGQTDSTVYATHCTPAATAGQSTARR